MSPLLGPESDLLFGRTTAIERVRALLRPLPGPDRVLLLVVVPLWLAGAWIHGHAAATGTLAWPGVVVASAPDSRGCPVVDAFQPRWDAETSGLRVGDRVCAIGGRSAEGLGPLAFAARVRSAAGSDLAVVVDTERDGRPGSAILPLRPIPTPWGYLAVSGSFVVCGLIVAIRAPRVRGARLACRALVAYGFMFLFFHDPWEPATYAWMAVSSLAFLLGPPHLVYVLLYAPEDAPPYPARIYRWVWLFAAFGVTYPSWLFGSPLPHAVGARAHFALGTAGLLTILVMLIHSYRHATPLGRQRVKWFFLGGYLSLMPFLVSVAVSIFEPGFWSAVAERAIFVLVAVPVCILISVSRASLFDIDRLLSAVASYTLSSVIFLAGLFAAVPLLGQTAAHRLELSEGSTLIGVALLLSLVFVLGHSMLRPRIHRWFFPERDALNQGLDALLRELDGSESPENAARTVGERLRELLRPARCFVFLRGAGGFEPVFSSGGWAPPAPLDGPLVALLRRHRGPVVQRPRFGPIPEREDAFEQAALGSLRAEVIVPVHVHADLVAFLALGAKGSGDIYTPRDLALLSALAERLTGEIEHPRSLVGGQHLAAGDAPSLVRLSGGPEAIVRRILPSVLVVDAGTRVGTGFMVAPRLALTSLHVVEGCREVLVTAVGGRCWKAHVAERARSQDLALLALPEEICPPLPLGRAEYLELGERLFAIGSPASTFGTLEHTVTQGIVSALRTFIPPDGMGRPLRFIQTDAALNRGNSGGPLVNLPGRVVGGCCLKEQGPDREGLSFAVAIEEALRVFPGIAEGPQGLRDEPAEQDPRR